MEENKELEAIEEKEEGKEVEESMETEKSNKVALKFDKSQFNSGAGYWFRFLQYIFMPGVAFIFWYPIVRFFLKFAWEKIPTAALPYLHTYMAISFVMYAVVSFVKVKVIDTVRKSTVVLDMEDLTITYTKYGKPWTKAGRNGDCTIYRIEDIDSYDIKKFSHVIKGKISTYDKDGNLLTKSESQKLKIPKAYEQEQVYDLIDAVMAKQIKEEQSN